MGGERAGRKSGEGGADSEPQDAEDLKDFKLVAGLRYRDPNSALTFADYPILNSKSHCSSWVWAYFVVKSLRRREGLMHSDTSIRS